MDLRVMDKHTKYTPLTKTYERVYNFVYEYCQDRFFPDIRGYSAFKKVERSIARQSAIKLTAPSRVAKSLALSACFAVGRGLKATGSLVNRHILTPAFTYGVVKPIEYAVVKPTMWALYSLNLKNRAPPPKRVFATSTGGRRTRKRSHKCSH